MCLCTVYACRYQVQILVRLEIEAVCSQSTDNETTTVKTADTLDDVGGFLVVGVRVSTCLENLEISALWILTLSGDFNKCLGNVG